MQEEATQDSPSSDIYSGRVADGLVNVVSGLGTAKARDPSTYLGRDHYLDRIELEDIYRYYWIAKAVDIKPWDMTRQWRTFSSETLAPENIKTIEEHERVVDAQSDVRAAMKWAALYGGGGLVMHVNGHGASSEPLDYERVTLGQLDRLSPADRWELIPAAATIDYNPLSPFYRTAEYYRIAHDTTGQLIHRSRVIFFRGREMPVRITRQLFGWGDSEVQRWYKAITNNETLNAAIVEGMHQSNIDVIAAKGLATTLAMAGGEEKIKDRFMVMDYCKSLLNMAIIDSEDSFTRNGFPMQGLAAIQKIFLEVLASATDIPTTRLLGSSPGGFNATGESDTRNYYDMIKSLQENDLAPKLYQLDQVLVRSALGEYPEDLSFKFNSLWQMTEEEESTLNETRSRTLMNLQTLGVPDYVILRDAVEMGIVKNLSIEEIDKLEEEDDFGVDEGNEDFDPETDPDNQDGGESDIDGLIESLVGGSVRDGLDFKEEKHKRDKGGQFSSTGGASGSPEGKGKKTAGKLEAIRKPQSKALIEQKPGGKQPDHIKALKVPPAWTNVRYSNDPAADLLVVGTDSKGRQQRIYSKEFTQRSAKNKFDRITSLVSDIGTIDGLNEKNKKAGVEEAFVFDLIRKTGLRTGSDVDTKAKKKAYGATTLEGRHVIENEDGSVTLNFTGKKGVELSIEITDKELSKELKNRKSAVGENEKLFDVKASKLREYSKSISEGKYKPKDLRTLVGTTVAALEVKKITKKPTNIKEYKKVVKDIAKKVSEKLGNTPTIALQSYINPTVFENIKVAA